MSYTLVVVDMQPSFSAKEEFEVTKNIQREIFSAIYDNAHIVFVEFSYSGPTLPCLLELPSTIGYKKHYVIEKHSNDGSVEVASIIKDKSLPADHIKVTGINTDYCVLATVAGLSRLYPDSKIEVVEDSCASLWDTASPNERHHLHGIESMKRYSNVSIKEKRTEAYPVYTMPSE
jgi:nicotinamidase-related amidase